MMASSRRTKAIDRLGHATAISARINKFHQADGPVQGLNKLLIDSR